MAKPLLSNKWLRSLRVERITNEVHPLRCFAGIPTHQPPPRCVGFLFKPGSFHVTYLANQFYRHAAPGSCFGCECPDVIGYNRCWTQKSPVGRTLPGLANSNSRELCRAWVQSASNHASRSESSRRQQQPAARLRNSRSWRYRRCPRTGRRKHTRSCRRSAAKGRTVDRHERSRSRRRRRHVWPIVGRRYALGQKRIPHRSFLGVNRPTKRHLRHKLIRCHARIEHLRINRERTTQHIKALHHLSRRQVRPRARQTHRMRRGSTIRGHLCNRPVRIGSCSVFGRQQRLRRRLLGQRPLVVSQPALAV